VSRAVRIEVRSVGQAFACQGDIVDAVTGERLATTRDFPHGQRSAAYAAAEEKVAERGWTVETDEDA
jgi:hypothetical protein